VWLGTLTAWFAARHMKIFKIKLNDYLHFRKGLEIDLTFPLGHAKAGKPLEKVCIVGQSGTGKTSLLNLIKCFTAETCAFDDRYIDRKKLADNAVEVHYEVSGNRFHKVRAPLSDQDFDYFKEDDPVPQAEEYKKFIQTKLATSKPRFIFFPFNVIPSDVADQSTTIKKDELAFSGFSPQEGTLSPLSPYDRVVWDLISPDIDVIAGMVFQEIDRYISRYKDVATECMAQVAANEQDDQERKKAIERHKQWQADNPNPIQKLADDCLNKLLRHLGLEVVTDPNAYRLSENGKREKHNFLMLRQRGTHIEYKYLSTGTKQLVLTILPLFFLKPKNSLVLFDQPEASLFPNIQLLLPETYSNVAPHNQFFHATHSPIVASAFDPWEIVDLRFDDEGRVYRQEYLEDGKERHVDNYATHPKYLRWDSIFKVMFGLNVEGNEERRLQLMNLARLEKQLLKTSNVEKKKEIYSQYVTLAEKLDWTTSGADETNQ
jgi:hypothetical protein